uniref:Uncharacterized protein n=1 Tax=Acrobeloides nanus TaxID=290746 RepID=A0A914CZ54_9BILA
MPKTSTILGNDLKLGYGKPTNRCYTYSTEQRSKPKQATYTCLKLGPAFVAEVNAEIAQLGCKDGQCSEFTPVYVKLDLFPFLYLGSTTG